jgi:hypothetical protein
MVDIEGPLFADFLDNLTESFDCALRGENKCTIGRKTLL